MMPLRRVGQRATVSAIAKDRDGLNPRGDNWRPTIRRALWLGHTHRSHQSQL